MKKWSYWQMEMEIILNSLFLALDTRTPKRNKQILTLKAIDTNGSKRSRYQFILSGGVQHKKKHHNLKCR